MYKKIFIFLMFILFCSSVSYGATWSEISGLIQKNSNELQSSKRQADAAFLSYKQSYTNFLPQLSLNASYTQTTTSTMQAQSQYSYGLSATQYLFRGFSSYYNVQSTYAGYQYSYALFKQTETTVYYNVYTAFNNLLIAQRNLELQKKILIGRKENTRLINLNYLSGTEDKGNLMQTQADQAAAEYRVSSAEKNLRLARLKFYQLLGVNITTVEGNMEIAIISNPDFNKLVEGSTDYLISKYQLDSAIITAKATISEFLPAVSLSGNLRKTGTDWPPNADGNSWSLNLSYPFFTGGSNIFDKMINDIRVDQARESFEQTKKDAYYNIEAAYENLKDAFEAMNASKVMVNAAGERAKIAQAKYLNGLVSYDEWYRIENDYINAQLSYINSQSSVFSAQANWYRSYGGFE